MRGREKPGQRGRKEREARSAPRTSWSSPMASPKLAEAERAAQQARERVLAETEAGS